MKKVLLALDSIQFSEGAFEFARRMNEKQPILLTGAFLPRVTYSGLWNYASVESGALLLPATEGEDAEAAKRNVARFEIACRTNDIDCRVHNDFVDFALPEFKKESRFADLVIVGSEVFYGTHGTIESSEYLKDALHVSEAPVLVVPEKFNFPETNILAYDGSESSVYAIKQFAYLFPEFCDNKTYLVTIGDQGPELPEEGNIEELIGRHFSYVSIMKIQSDGGKDFTAWLSERSNPILVAGSFGRSFWSRLFKKSFVTDLITDHKLPVFISHR